MGYRLTAPPHRNRPVRKITHQTPRERDEERAGPVTIRRPDGTVEERDPYTEEEAEGGGVVFEVPSAVP